MKRDVSCASYVYIYIFNNWKQIMLIQKCSCTHHSPGPLFLWRQQLKLAQTSGREDFKRTIYLYSLCIFLFKKRNLHISVTLTARMPQICHCDVIYEQSQPYQTTQCFAKLLMVTESSQGRAQLGDFYSCKQRTRAGAGSKGPWPETDFLGFKRASKFSQQSGGVWGSDPVAHVAHVKIFTERS